LVALALLSSSVWLSAAPAKADFCQTGKVRDYEKPLKRLPRVPAPPSNGHLGFAPQGTSLGRFASVPFQVGPGAAGYVLTFSPKDEDSRPSRRLNWRIEASLVKLDRSGKAVGKPRRIEKNVNRLRPVDLNYLGLEFSFNVPGEPALYRVEITFENSAGERLGRFGENFRVLKPSLDVDLVLDGTTFRRGEFVRAWLVNRGVGFLFFGLGRVIEYWDGATWTAPPVKFPGGPVPAIGLAAGPGEKHSCWSTTIPPDAAPGTYRFRTNVDYSPAAPGGRPVTRLEPRAEFTVTE
jgi:hypothetical protein